MKVKYSVQVMLKKQIRLKLGNSFELTNLINQECYSKQEAKTFINQWLKEEVLSISLYKLKKHWS